MRKLFSILGLVFSCVLAQAAAVNWTNYVPNIQVATNANVANQLQLGTTFTDGHLWPNAPDGTTPWYLEHTVPHTSGNLFQLIDPIGGPYFAITWLWEIQGADLLLTGSAQVQGTVRANNLVATNNAVTASISIGTNAPPLSYGTNTFYFLSDASDPAGWSVPPFDGVFGAVGYATNKQDGIFHFCPVFWPDPSATVAAGASGFIVDTVVGGGGSYGPAGGVYGQEFFTDVTTTNTLHDVHGGSFIVWAPDSIAHITGDVYGLEISTVPYGGTVDGNIYGVHSFTDLTYAGTVNGTAYNFYARGTAPSLFEGALIAQGAVTVGTTVTATNGFTTAEGGTIAFTNDVKLVRDTANVLALRNGTTAQGLRVYNTWANAGTDYERGTINWTDTPNSFTIGTKMGGTGTSRSLQFSEGGTNIFYLDGATGKLLWNTDNTYDVGASGANRMKNFFCAGAAGIGGGCQIEQQTAGSAFSWSSKSRIYSPSDGVIEVSNAGTTDFKRLQFGGTTALFPATARNLTGFTDVVADDTAPTWHLSSRQITVKTTNYTLVGSAATCSTNTDVSKIFVNYGVTAMSTNTLPTCVAGHTFTFMVEDGDGMMIVAAGGATIRIAATASAANGWISATAIGNTITLVGNSQATEWVALSHEGTWTFGP